MFQLEELSSHGPWERRQETNSACKYEQRSHLQIFWQSDRDMYETLTGTLHCYEINLTIVQMPFALNCFSLLPSSVTWIINLRPPFHLSIYFSLPPQIYICEVRDSRSLPYLQDRLKKKMTSDGNNFRKSKSWAQPDFYSFLFSRW